MSQVYRIQENYREALRQAVGKDFSNAFSTETADTDTLRRDVKKDLPRTVYFTRNPALVGEEGETAKPIQDLWRQEDTYPAYTQGNIDSRVMSEVLMVRVEQQFMMKGDMEYIEARRTSIGFGYIDKNGIECGFSVSHSNKYPGIFCVALGKNMRVGSPDEREMTVYVSSAGPDTPSLKDVIVEGYSDDNLQDQATMREELLGDDSLPDEVKALIRAILTPEGTLDIGSAKEISEALKTNSANHTVFFELDRQAKQKLDVYRTSCQAAIQELEKVRDNDEVSKEDKDSAAKLKREFQATNLQIKGALRAINKAASAGTHTFAGTTSSVRKCTKIQQRILENLKKTSANHLSQDTIVILRTLFSKQEHQVKQDLSVYQTFCENTIRNLSEIKGEKEEEALALKDTLQATSDKITRTLDANKDAPQTGEYALVSQHADIKEEILGHLEHAMVNTPYQQTLKTMQARFAHANRSFGERRGTSTGIGGALTVLAVAGAAIIAAGLLVNPIGLAIASAASVAVGAASLISWGVAAYKEFRSAQERGALGQALTDEVDKLTESGGQKEMLDMVVGKTGAGDAPEAPTKTPTKARTTFFKEAYRQATQKDQEPEDEIEAERDGPKSP